MPVYSQLWTKNVAEREACRQTCSEMSAGNWHDMLQPQTLQLDVVAQNYCYSQWKAKAGLPPVQIQPKLPSKILSHKKLKIKKIVV